MSPSTSTRWSPTPEQLMILEEMYKGGVRTPNASQIQKITAHLSFYGKIEGKNVFYWFQNHKARDRQKLRKKLSKQLQQQQQLLQDQLLLHQYDQNPQNYNATNFLSLIDPPHHHRLHDTRAAQYLRQGGSDEASARMTNYTWKMDHQKANLQESENCMIRSPGDDWMMMMMSMTRDADPTSTFPCCSNRPLKTLELFPITAPSLKEHQIQGTTSEQNVSPSTSVTN